MSSKLTSEEIARSLLEERKLLLDSRDKGNLESWNLILEKPEYWSLKHEGESYSVKNMTDEEIQECIIEDLLFAAYEINQGAFGEYPLSQITKHLNCANDQIPRVYLALSFVIKEGYVTVKQSSNSKENILILNPDRFEDAQDFCGVYITDFQDDFDTTIDTIIDIGGEPLLSDVINDIITDVEKLE